MRLSETRIQRVVPCDLTFLDKMKVGYDADHDLNLDGSGNAAFREDFAATTV